MRQRADALWGWWQAHPTRRPGCHHCSTSIGRKPFPQTRTISVSSRCRRLPPDPPRQRRRRRWLTPTGSPVATATPRPTPVVTPVISGPNEANSTIPFVYTRDATAKVALPAQNNANVIAGSQVQVTLSNWLSKNRAAPTSVWLAPTGHQDTPNEDAPANLTFSVSSPPDSKGNCTLLVTIPSGLDSALGSKTATLPYLLIVGGPGIYQRSDPFRSAQRSRRPLS